MLVKRKIVKKDGNYMMLKPDGEFWHNIGKRYSMRGLKNFIYDHGKDYFFDIDDLEMDELMEVKSYIKRGFE